MAFFFLSYDLVATLPNNEGAIGNFLHVTVLMLPGCLLLIFALAAGECCLGKALPLSVPVFLGTISCSIYLSHDLVGSFAYIELGAPHPLLPLAVIGATIAVVSTGLYRLVELPAKSALAS
ncbi:MAG: hypothetical protein JO366_17495 [Methylobacteriaceae bacterium]|nr:hypothetical protein [Methylobacteriaceae bacterium]MBV9246595.1 hypothetical protein [Methylobacteriaceae bacterium]